MNSSENSNRSSKLSSLKCVDQSEKLLPVFQLQQEAHDFNKLQQPFSLQSSSRNSLGSIGGAAPHNHIRKISSSGRFTIFGPSSTGDGVENQRQRKPSFLGHLSPSSNTSIAALSLCSSEDLNIKTTNNLDVRRTESLKQCKRKKESLMLKNDDMIVENGQLNTILSESEEIKVCRAAARCVHFDVYDRSHSTNPNFRNYLNTNENTNNALNCQCEEILKSNGEQNFDNNGTMNLKSWRHMKTLERPPIMDFYRNLSTENGVIASRPSMLELLHGGDVNVSQKSFENFKKENENFVESQIAAVECSSTNFKNASGNGSNDLYKCSLKMLNGEDNSRRSKSDVFIDSVPSAVMPAKLAMDGALNGSSSRVNIFTDLNGVTSCSTVVKKNVTTPNRSKFGWVEGVFVRCILNIFGVMLYLRISWVSGQAGIILGCVVVLLASLVTTITALSTCAICTNGDVKGGGAYFLISRSLGPEFGGSIGLIFSVANAVGAAMYIVGFSETMRDLLREHSIVIVDGGLNDVRIIGLVTCLLLIAIVFIGTSFESKMQMGLLVILVLSIIDYAIGSFVPLSDEQRRRGITGLKLETFQENLLPNFRDGYNFFSVFAIYFPAATGIMAGANISGDLSNPQKAIPLGTLLAIFVTTVIYLIIVIMTGSSCVRYADGVNFPELLSSEKLMSDNASSIFENISSTFAPLSMLTNTEATSMFGDGTNKEFTNSWILTMYKIPTCAINNTCPYGLMNYFQVMEFESFWGPLITAGIFAATLSSALASLVSAPKIFQAVCKDRLYPYINRFSKGSGKDEEPRRAYFLGFAVAMIMIIIDVNWGSSTQAHSYRTALQSVNRLEHTDEHVKNYRPQVLVLTGNPATRPSLVDFVHNITKGNSLMICGCVIPYMPSDSVFLMIYRLKEHLRNWLRKRHVKSFITCVANSNLRNGVQAMLQSCGLGKLRPNIVVMGFKHNWIDEIVSIASLSIYDDGDEERNSSKATSLLKLHQDEKFISSLAQINDYFAIIQDAFDMNMGVAILRSAGSEGLDLSENMRILHNHRSTAVENLLAETNKKMNNGDLIVHIDETVKQRSNAEQESVITECTLKNNDDAAKDGMENKSSAYAAIENGTPIEETMEIVEDYFNNEENASGSEDSNQFNVSNTEESDQDCSVPESGNMQNSNRFKGMLKTRFNGVEDNDDVGYAKSKSNGSVENEKLVGGTGGVSTDNRSCSSLNRRRSSRRLTNAQRNLTLSVNRFQRKIRSGTIDVWWLYDDGGLTLLIPYLLTQQRSYLERAKMRIFTISTSASGIEQEQRNMASLLSKFRIEFSALHVIADISQRPKNETIRDFEKLVAPFRVKQSHIKNNACMNKAFEDNHKNATLEGLITDAEWRAQEQKIMRQLKIAELLQLHSTKADLIVLSMPVPRKGLVSSTLYLAWLDFMTRNLPSTLLVRGNQNSVLTFYS